MRHCLKEELNERMEGEEKYRGKEKERERGEGRKRGEGRELATRNTFNPSVSALTAPKEVPPRTIRELEFRTDSKESSYMVTVGKQELWLP